QRNGGEHPRRELLTRERRVSDGRLLRIPESGADSRATGTRAVDLAGGVERAVIGVLCDDSTQLEEERRLVVPEADEVEQELAIRGADDLLVVIGPFAAEGPRAKTGRTGAHQQREQAWYPDRGGRLAVHRCDGGRHGAFPPPLRPSVRDRRGRRARGRSRYGSVPRRAGRVPGSGRRRRRPRASRRTGRRSRWCCAVQTGRSS